MRFDGVGDSELLSVAVFADFSGRSGPAWPVFGPPLASVFSKGRRYPLPVNPSAL
jgi:hypothetical protein